MPLAKTRVEVLESAVSALRRPHLEPYWDGEYDEAEWGGRSRIRQDFAAIYAVLAAETGNQTYRDEAVAYLTDIGEGDHFASILTGTAYELVGDELTDAERASFADTWVAGADAALGQYVDERESEWEHVPNHAIAACFYADYARHLFPDEAAAYEFSDRTDPVWQSWWNRREFHEQASNYEGFAESMLAQWAGLRGLTDEFYASRSVQNMLERNTRVVTPGGMVAPYGDSSYHQHQCTWLALFERVAADTGDGRYQAVADDVFSYFGRRVAPTFAATLNRLPETESVYNGRLVFKTHAHELAWLALATHWRDSTVDFRRRPTPDGRIRRLPQGYVLDESDLTRLPSHELVDGQVALTGGDTESGTKSYLLLSVGPALVHDHADAGAIQLLTYDESTLLGTNGYLQRELLYHNVPYAQPTTWDRYPADDHDKLLTGDNDTAGEITEFGLGARSAHCQVRYDSFHGLPIDVTREIDVEPDGAVVVRDGMLAHEAGYCGGPLFHAERIDELTDGRYKLRTETLRSMDHIETTNPPGALLVDVGETPAETSVVEPNLPPIYEESYDEFPTTEYKQLWQRSYTARRCLAAQTELVPGAEMVFETRLEPTHTQ
ncbi:hypothetical protein [Haloarchaeobius sp. DFWS5]|uniref:hypothetical protein n=1 Tax=Haloarchaeobius sp. DFWS5 TaxID=3446114 RepID=UPI003EB9B76F